ncbi:MAG: EthD family reductase [Caldimonas sp.]
MWQFVALYRRPDDPDAFEHHYRTVHIPLVRNFPGLRRMTFSRVESESTSRAEPAVCFISTMYWDDRESLDIALRSEARKLAYEDTAKFRHFQIGRYIGAVEDVEL